MEPMSFASGTCAEVLRCVTTDSLLLAWVSTGREVVGLSVISSPRTRFTPLVWAESSSDVAVSSYSRGLEETARDLDDVARERVAARDLDDVARERVAISSVTAVTSWGSGGSGADIAS